VLHNDVAAQVQRVLEGLTWLLNGSVPLLRDSPVRYFGLAGLPIALTLEKRILETLATPGRPGVRKIAARFGVNPATGSGSAALSTG
jgi:hypothetical protein